jgi:hypothetical protein
MTRKRSSKKIDLKNTRSSYSLAVKADCQTTLTKRHKGHFIFIKGRRHQEELTTVN